MGQFIDFNHVKTNADFVAILNHYDISTKGDGEEVRCKCPFHDDNEPSMSINLEKKVFACHAASCGDKGNILDFVSKMEESDLRSAAAELAKICGSTLAPAQRKKTRTKSDKKPARDLDTKKTAQQSRKKEKRSSDDKKPVNPPLSFKLTLDPEHEYGCTRSLSPAVISQLEMGYCNRGLMKGRWCVPVHNSEGDCIAYCGRYASDEIPEGEAKYLLPKGFVKSDVLFNLHRIAGQSDEVVLVEGVFDTARLHGLAMPAVGLFGSSISDRQIELLHETGFNRVYVALDGGSKKAIKRMLYRLAPEFFTRAILLPEGEDPASAEESFLLQHVPVVGS